MELTEEEVVEVRLPATFTATQMAREVMEDVSELEPFEDLRFAAALVVTELVANSVRHAGLAPADDIALLVECSDGVLYAEVSDGGPGFFPLPYTRGRAGRVEHGLHLVNVLADRWGFRREDGSCCVWFELDLVAGRRAWHGRDAVWFH